MTYGPNISGTGQQAAVVFLLAAIAHVVAGEELHAHDGEHVVGDHDDDRNTEIAWCLFMFSVCYYSLFSNNSGYNGHLHVNVLVCSYRNMALLSLH